MRFLKILFICLVPAIFLSSCSSPKLKALEEYKSNMSAFFDAVQEYNDSINSVDMNDTAYKAALLQNLDGLKAEFDKLKTYTIPEEFASINSITNDAADSMAAAVNLYHKAYDGEFDQSAADEAFAYYTRANKELKIILQVLHGEDPSAMEGATLKE